MTNPIQRALDNQAKLEELAWTTPGDIRYCLHLRNAYPYMRAVLEAAFLASKDVCGLLQGCGIEGDPTTCGCVPHTAQRALTAWADHVNGEDV